MTPSELVDAIVAAWPNSTVVPKGTETKIHLDCGGTVRVLLDGRIATSGLIPPAVTDLLIDY
jgi:hypothetical protein